MKKVMVFVAFGIAVFLFWMLGYPETLCYQDAVRCIQNHGNVPGSAYDAYVRMMMTR